MKRIALYIAVALGLAGALVPGAVLAQTAASAIPATAVSASSAIAADPGQPGVAGTSTSDTSSVSGPLFSVAKSLKDEGIVLRSGIIDHFANSTTGGIHQGHSNVGQFNIGADFDLDKMLGLTGGSMHFAVYRDYGESLNKYVTCNFTKRNTSRP